MISLLSPTILKYGGIIVLILALFGFGVYVHHLVYEEGYTAAEAIYQKSEAAATAIANKQLAEDNAKIAAAQDIIDSTQIDLSNKQKELQNEKVTSSNYKSDLLDSRKRLSVLVALSQTGTASQVVSSTAPRLDNKSEVTAYIDPTVASNLAGITTTGDSAITRLNACIEAYNAVKAASDAQQ